MNVKTRIFFFFLCAFLSNIHFFTFANAQECCVESKDNLLSQLSFGWRDYCSNPYRVYVAHSEGDGIGYEGGYTTLGTFAAPTFNYNSHLVPFFDGRAQFFNDRRLGTNLGLGARGILPQFPLVMGLNVYYDYLNEHHNSFQQLGLGYELFTPYFDFRVNGYFPIGNKCQVAHKRVIERYQDFVFREGDQYAPFTGVDAELGTWIDSRCGCENFAVYLAAGPYYYKKTFCCCHKTHAFGGRGRLIVPLCDWLSVNASASYDSYWRGRGQVQLVVCLPFERFFGTGLDDTLHRIARQPVYRQEIIPVAKQRVYDWNGL